MKVLISSPRAAAVRRALLAITLSMAFLLSPALSQRAHALTRVEVLRRANAWVARRVPYSQRGSYQGYRRDCSGMVSMAWALNRSYTSRTIRTRARKIALSQLRPGDAVLTPGHVEIFGGWKDSKKRTYISIGQTTRGSHARRSVRRLSRRAVGLRLKSISETPPAQRMLAEVAPAAAAVLTTFTPIPTS